MGWWIRFGVVVIVLGLAHKLGPCFAADYVVDIWRSFDGGVDYDAYDVRDSRSGSCSSDSISLWWYIIPSIPGTCYANIQNCTSAGGSYLYASTNKCPGDETCCYILQNTTAPTMPTMPTMPTIPGLNFTQPSGLLNCTTPTFNPQNPGAVLTPNCTTSAPPTIPGSG